MEFLRILQFLRTQKGSSGREHRESSLLSTSPSQVKEEEK